MAEEAAPNRDSIEPAPSGRARCRACQRSIEKGSPRFAEIAPNPMTEGDTKHFYHPLCAAERRSERLLAFLESHPEALEERPRLLEAAAFGSAHPRLQRLGGVGRSPSGRAACRHCRQNIDKGALRVALQPIEEGRAGSWGFLHAACARSYAQAAPSLDRLQRYSPELGAEDWTELADALTKEVAAAPREGAEAAEDEA